MLHACREQTIVLSQWVVNDMKICVEDLDEGNDPISAGWEDGLGHPCTFDGWNEE